MLRTLLAVGLVCLTVGCGVSEPAPEPAVNDDGRPAMTVDDRYLASITPSNTYGPMNNASRNVIDLGQLVCRAFDVTSMTSAEVMLSISGGEREGKRVTDAGEIVSSAKTYYCPQHQNR